MMSSKSTLQGSNYIICSMDSNLDGPGARSRSCDRLRDSHAIFRIVIKDSGETEYRDRK